MIVVDTLVHGLQVDLQTDLSQPPGDELGRPLVLDGLRVGPEAQLYGLTLVVANAVAVRVAIAGRVQRRAGLGQVERTLLGGGRLP